MPKCSENWKWLDDNATEKKDLVPYFSEFSTIYFTRRESVFLQGYWRRSRNYLEVERKLKNCVGWVQTSKSRSEMKEEEKKVTFLLSNEAVPVDHVVLLSSPLRSGVICETILNFGFSSFITWWYIFDVYVSNGINRELYNVMIYIFDV